MGTPSRATASLSSRAHPRFQDALRKHGEEGWELVHVDIDADLNGTRDGHRLILKRRPNSERLDVKFGLTREACFEKVLDHRPEGSHKMSEDAAKVAPHIYKVLFENERARLLEVIMQPGDSSEMHSHPDNLLYVLSSGKVTFTAPSGETAELEVAAGASMWMEATEHATENVGGTAIRALFFEPK